MSNERFAMGFVVLAADLYFAALFGVAGLAKLNHPHHFITTLRQQGILPNWSIALVGYIVPRLEVAIAFLLIVGLFPQFTGIMLLLLCLGFLLIKLLLIHKRSTADCGCGSITHLQSVDGVSIVVSMVLFGLAIFHLWGVMTITPIDWLWRLPGVITFIFGGCWLIYRMFVLRNLSST